MDTSNLKPFATEMRTLLMNGVKQQMRYWGFADGPEPSEAVEKVEGGYLFRGEVHRGERVPAKWKALKKAVEDHSVKDVVEAAASTWFNRLMAIRILEKNGHDRTILGYAPDTSQPQILYNAAQGILPYGTEAQKQTIQKAIQDGDDDAALRTLLTAYANDHDLLKDVFGRVEDYTELLLPTRLTNDGGILDTIVTTDAITDEDYEQVELIGWLYQFYISEKKDEVYDQSGKFRPEDIPAATQIFTPNWIVKYMVENTVGKLWLEANPDSPLREDMEYLVENGGEGEGEKENDGEPLVEEPRDLQLFDPAAGSGHILVEGFDLLVKIYTDAGYTTREAVEFILTENLLGLDIDRRAAELARFALLMKAAQHDKRVLKRRDLRPHVYAMPEPRTFSSADLRAYLGDDAMDQHGEAIREALEQIREHGQNVGSALKLSLSEDARTAIREALSDWSRRVQNDEVNFLDRQLHDELGQYLLPALLLTGRYPAVAMNPPYMGSRQMNADLKTYAKKQYPMSKRDLFAVFMEVGQANTQRSGRLGMINQQSWMFLSSYEDLRKHVIDTIYIESMLHLGPRTFDEIGGEVVQSTAFTLQNEQLGERTGTYFRLVEESDASAKKDAFEAGEHRHEGVEQQDFEKIPGAPIAYWVSSNVIEIFDSGSPLKERAELRQGLATGDNAKYLRLWTEVSVPEIGSQVDSVEELWSRGKTWVPHCKGGADKRWWDEIRYVLKFDKASFQQLSQQGNKLPSRDYYFQRSLAWSRISSDRFGIRYSPQKSTFDCNSTSLFSDNLRYHLGFLSSKVSGLLLGVKAPTLTYQVGDVEEMPVLSESSTLSAVERVVDRNISISHSSSSLVETSWDFTQPPLIQQNAPTLDAAYTAWQEQATDDFLQLHANEEELNELFIDLYGLQDELSPRVALGDITILEDELDWDAVDTLDAERDGLSDHELRARFLEEDPSESLFKMEVPIRQLLSYGIGVMLGRYRLGKDGLHIAHPNPSREEIAPYTVQTPNGEATFEIDDEAILPIMGQDSPFSDDAVYRMRQILEMVWGKDQLTESVNFVNRALSVGRSRGLKRNYTKTMEEWLVNDFWDYHKKLYSVPYYGKKPIYWLFQSPEKHFQALVYMHRMDKYTVQKVRQQYLHVFQNYLRSEIAPLEAKSDSERTNDEQKRLETLRAKVEDARAYDPILKEVADQQIEIDLDDGVQENYPLFGDAVAPL